jgi:hypothetical protein
MTQAERYAWLSLMAWLLILFFLVARFTTGYEFLGQTIGLTIVEQSAAQLLVTYVTLGIVAAILEVLIIVPMVIRTGHGDIIRDERDRAIDARANAIGYVFLAGMLHVIVFHVLANAAFGGHILPRIDLASLTGVAFALLFVLTSAEIVKRVAVIFQYHSA